MDDSHPSDLASLRVDFERVRQPAKPKKWQRHYVNVPWQWVERLRESKRISTYRLALVLLYEHWRTGGRTIVLSNVFTFTEGLPARSKWRAIAELESLGLIQVERKRSQAPRVTLRHLARKPPWDRSGTIPETDRSQDHDQT
jgi:hypothetical protein